jgi:hypothetical protein
MADKPEDELLEVQDIQEAQPTQESQQSQQSQEEETSINLGDRILIESRRYKSTLGKIYYIDESLIRVLPDGVSDRLYDFPLSNGEFAPDIGVTSVEFEEGPRTGFVGLTGLRANSKIDTFSANGDPIGIFTIKEVNETQDSAIISDSTEAEILLEFGGRGLPLDTPFAVLRLSPESEREGEREGEEEAEEEVAEGTEEDDEIVDIGTLTIPIAASIVEIGAKDQTFPDTSQKSDLIADLLSYFGEASRKNPILKKRIRALTELFFELKTDITNSKDDGSINGEKKISFDLLSEILENRSVPLARPVLTTKRVLQVDELADSASEKHTEQVDIYSLNNTLAATQQFIDTYGGLQAGQDEASSSSLPIFYQWLGGLLQRFPLGDLYLGDNYTFTSDSEFLRHDIEDLEGFGALQKDRDDILSDSDLGTLNLSLRRGLGPTIRKYGDGGQRVVGPACSADSKFYLLFPERASGQLGATRTGSLFLDINRSKDEIVSLRDIIDRLGDPTEEPDATNILILKTGSSTLSGTTWAEYLEVVLKAMTPRGAGDVKTFLNDYGVVNKEFTVEQQEAVSERVKEVLLLVRGLIRRIITDMATEPPTHESMQGDTFRDYILDTVKEHPALQEIITDAKERTPGWSQTDLGLLGALYRYSQDYALSVLGKEPIGIQRERLRASRNKFIKSLHNAQQVRMNNLAAGKEPEVNPCPHVKALDQIRRIKDDSERIALLAIFIRNYQGSEEGKWISCNFCKLGLICKHELLQVQQYLHPREFDVLQKEIILNYTGGTFGAKHVCKNCGIPISDIEYDRNVEFDDEGRPMNGRGATVDTDAVEEENLAKKLGAPVGTEQEIAFETEDKTMIYQTTRQLCDRIGIFPDATGYKRIVNRVNVELLRQDRKSYMETQKRKKAAGEKTSDYDVYINRLLVSFVAACLLLEIQMKIPDYTLRYAVPGCRAGFDGYPLYPTADPKSVSDSTGIHYLACAITGITSDKAPWVLTGWQQERSDTKRQLLISNAIITVVRTLSQEPTTQLALEKKRDYLKEIFGKESDTGLPSEKIPYRFQPPIGDMSAIETIVPEAAKQTAASSLALNWIRAANNLAKVNSRIVPNSPFTETGCCFTTIDKPSQFWDEKTAELPLLPQKLKIKFALSKQTWFFVPYEARPIVVSEVETPIDLAYKIFGRICWKGTRTGLPHELGFDGKCDWCDIQIPIEVLYPDVDKYGKPVVGDEALQNSFTEQGITINKESFEELLQASHTVNSFENYLAPKPEESGIILNKLGLITPEPADSWKDRMASVIRRLSLLKNGAGQAEIADALEDIAVAVADSEQSIARRIGEDAFASISTIFSEPVSSVFEIMKSCFIIPIQRIITAYNTDQLKVHRQYELSQDHVMDIITNLKQHTKISSSINRDTLGEFGLAKYRYYIQQMSAILKYTSELKASRIAYGSYILPYIARALIMCPLADLLDPNKVPVEAAELAGLSAGKSAKSILVTVRALIQLFIKERLNYSLDLVKEKIAKADEKERDSFINDIDKMGDDDKKLELIRKNLGLGRWAIGGTKLIYSYDPDQYDKEREARLGQYVGGEGLPEAPAGRQADKFGIFSFKDEYTEREGGYDFVFYDVDDAQ